MTFTPISADPRREAHDAWADALLFRLAGVTHVPRRVPAALPGDSPPARLPPGPAVAQGPADALSRLAALRAEVAACTKCRLHSAGRTQTVFSDGSPSAAVMFIGEGPGGEEDKQGLPFVGPAGQLLTKIIEAMGLARADVYIANVVKCRPPQNRTPEPDEMAACLPYLEAQIACVRPRAIVCLGNVALQGLFGPGGGGITKARGHWREVQGIPVMPTFHPAYLLRNPADKRLVWEDMKQVRARLGDPAGGGA